MLYNPPADLNSNYSAKKKFLHSDVNRQGLQTFGGRFAARIGRTIYVGGFKG